MKIVHRLTKIGRSELDELEKPASEAERSIICQILIGQRELAHDPILNV